MSLTEQKEVIRLSHDDITRDAKAAGEPTQTSASAAKIGLVKSITSPVLAWKTVYSREFFQPPEYNLSEVGRVEDVESYVRQAHCKKVGLMFKSGYSITGPNHQTINYIARRLAQIEQAQGRPFYILLREIGYDLIKYNNAYLVKVRRQQASGGRRRKDFRTGKTLDPVAAYFRMSPETVWVKRDIYGNVLQYRQQMLNGLKRVFFEPEDVIHIYKDRKGGFAVGTPVLVPVMDDIRALRRLEENIELLVYQHLFPLLHYQVGTENQPATVLPNGQSEVDVVRAQIEAMPAEGCIVTPERHSISVIGAEGRALRADWYLNHFKQRVFAGLGMSAMDFGESATANRSTAERLSRALIDSVKDYQEVLASFINYEIIRELLLESTWGAEALEPENLVWFTFAEIDEDAKIKRDSNAINLYQGNLITESEARIEIGRQPITEEQRADMFFERVTKPKNIILALDEPYNTRSTSAPERNQNSPAAIAAPQTEPDKTPTAKRTSNITQPTNQHGRKTGPERRLSWAQDATRPATTGEKRALRLYTMYLGNVVASILRDHKADLDWLQQLSYLTANQLNRAYLDLLRTEFFRGLGQAYSRQEPALVVALTDLQRYSETQVDRLLRNAEKTILSLVERYSDQEELARYLQHAVNSLGWRADFFHQSTARRAFLWGKAQALRLAGHVSLQVVPDEAGAGCPACAAQSGRLFPTDSLTLQDLPPYHSGCLCDLRPFQE